MADAAQPVATTMRTGKLVIIVVPWAAEHLVYHPETSVAVVAQAKWLVGLVELIRATELIMGRQARREASAQGEAVVPEQMTKALEDQGEPVEMAIC